MFFKQGVIGHPAEVMGSRYQGVHWLRRGLRNCLVHAEGAAFLVNPAANS